MYKNLFKAKKAVIFDLDDTLVKTSPLWDAALRSVCEGIGTVWPGFGRFVGVRLEVIWDRIVSDETYTKITMPISELVQKTVQKFLQLVAESDIEESEGFWELVYELKEDKKFKIGLVSNSPRKVVESVFAKLGISQIFDAIVCGDEVKRPKPDSEMYKKAAKLLEVSPRHIVAFEDSPTGAKASVAAGCTTIVVYDATFSESDYPKQVATMISGFDDVVGRMDLTFRETLEKTAQQLEQERKQEQTPQS
ncbi:MAG: HAD family phosphatase [Patescibacteria group bacterium]|jgi:HAD superfamily hydrolase (TIGR01509 family)